MVSEFNIYAKYAAMTAKFHRHDGRPLIGITSTFNDEQSQLNKPYYMSIVKAGGVPYIIPPFNITDGEAWADDLLSKIDGILFSGGGDINPLYFDEQPIPELGEIASERDEMELLLMRMAADRQIPILGICRGMQVMNVAFGGKVLQDIYAQGGDQLLKHKQMAPRPASSHTVTISDSSTLCRIYGCNELAVNSFHHQAVEQPAPGFKVTARSADGIVEAMESNAYKSILAVQWHPECLANTWETKGNVFTWLIDEAREFKAAKAVHSKVLSLDSHCDTPMFFEQHIDFGSRDPKILVDLHKMNEGHLDATIMVAYLKQLERDPKSLKAAVDKANSILTQIEEMVAIHEDCVGLAYTPEDLYAHKAEGKKSIMLGIENGYAIGSDLSNVERFRSRGVVYMTLCHNGDNDLCDSAKGNGEHGGVSEFGGRVIREMNRVGMMVDLSHAAESSFYDALDISTTPIVCSHSSARALCNHPRNLTDDQLKALAKAGGVAQVTFYPGFLREHAAEATILDAIEHLNHFVDVMGIDHVGIGTDFDGDGGVPGCESASELINFTRQMLKHRYSFADIQKIWGGNFLRVMQTVQAVGL